jgi:hypothetical protein
VAYFHTLAANTQATPLTLSGNYVGINRTIPNYPLDVGGELMVRDTLRLEDNLIVYNDDGTNATTGGLEWQTTNAGVTTSLYLTNGAGARASSILKLGDTTTEVHLSTDGAITAAQEVTTAGIVITCPAGFTSIEKTVAGVRRQLGCIETDNNTYRDCRAAINYCWDTFGAKLPSYNQARAAYLNFPLTYTNSTRDEWTDIGYYQSYNGDRRCGLLIRDTPGTPGSMIFDSGNTGDWRSFRCWIGH